MRLQDGSALAMAVLALLAASICAKAGVDEATPQDIFARRILPIFKSPNPSSCTQCHLAGVDLKNYIMPSHEKTFLSLRDQGLIDLKDPGASKILELIKMGEKDSKEAALIHARTRQAEYEAFALWIKTSCNDPRPRDAPKLAGADLAQPARPVEVIRHARKDRLLESFENNIWAMRFRCMNCHIEDSEANAKYVKEFGERVAWIKKDGPAATMDYLIASKLIDIKDPANSMLLLKPLREVEHKGGKKFLPGDQGYKAFRAWLEDYAKIARDMYTTAAALPKEKIDIARFSTDIWLKLNNTPPAWGDHLLQVTLYKWDAQKKAWETTPIATSDRPVWGQGKAWQHNLTLVAAKDSARAKDWRQTRPTLPSGPYLVKVHVDVKDRLLGDWTAALGHTDYRGQAEVTSRWPEGYGKMTVVDAAGPR